MKKPRAEVVKELHAASSWLLIVFESARDSGMIDVAGHIRAAEMSLNAAFGAIAAKQEKAS